MNTLRERAARAGIVAEFHDGLGRYRIAQPEVLARLLDILGTEGDMAARVSPPLVALRHGHDHILTCDAPAGCPVAWEIRRDDTIVRGEGEAPGLRLPGDLVPGTFELTLAIRLPEGVRTETSRLLVSPAQAFQGAPGAPPRTWALAVQLYGVRSRENWGHGDFGDLARLIDLAAALGAGGVGLNPLHALFDDRAEEASPYSPNSRFFLNTLYVDVAAIPEFPGLAAAGLESEVAALRAGDLVPYGRVAAAKAKALALAHRAFRQGASPARRQTFEDFRRAQGPRLSRFAAFEVLRRRFAQAWWEWPAPWRTPDDAAVARLRASDGEAMEQVEFAQWVADDQLAACKRKAMRLGLPIGLYVDLAVGVRADSFDAWNDQAFLLRELEIGAPPDLLNVRGQKWGLAGLNPVELVRRGCEPIRELLRAAMRHAGAMRLDHVLGLNRLYVVLQGCAADEGVYVRFPFEALLATIAQESVRAGCIVIGEDLGTVPEGFREKLAAYGLWSYHVMMFERAADGGFVAPDHYRQNALVTFSTHDLPTFRGWLIGHDLAVKRAIGLDPGENDAERNHARARMRATLAAQGLDPGDGQPIDYAAVVEFLASTPSRLLVVSMEDALGLSDQVNVPGTIDEHPNWRRRLPVALEDLAQHEGLQVLAEIADKAGRKTP